MRKRWACWLVVGVAVAFLAVLLDPTHVLRGLLRGESFFRGRPTSYWSKLIRSQNPEFDRAFGLTLGQEGNAAAVPVLIELLGDEDDQVRFIACNALAVNGREARAAAPALLKMLRHPDVYHRRNAAVALAAIGPEARPAMPVLIEALRDEDAFVNYYAATAVGRLGPEANEAVPALLDLLKSKKAEDQILSGGWMPGPDEITLRKDGEHTFLQVTPKSPREDDSWTVGYAARWALLQIDPDAAAEAGVQ